MDDMNLGRERALKHRARRANATQHLFTARPEITSSAEPYQANAFVPEKPAAYYPNEENQLDEFVPDDPFAPYDALPAKRAQSQEAWDAYTPNERAQPHEAWDVYTPSEKAQSHEAWDTYTPNEPAVAEVYIKPQEEAEDVSAAYDSSAAVFPSVLHENPYARPASQAFELDEQSAFAPPPKFPMPKSETFDLPLGPFPLQERPRPQGIPQANVYQPKAATWMDTSSRESLVDYQVKKESDAPGRKRRKKRTAKRVVAVAGLLCLLGTAAFLGRDWIAQQIAILSGESAETLAGQAAMSGTGQVKGYDPAQAVKISDKAQNGIAEISGTLSMEAYAVTQSNVVTRVQTGEDLYDYYLFAAANGQLLGYFEGLSPTGFAVQPDDSFYVEQEPYLLDSEGKVLLNTSIYGQYVGNHAVLSAFENGWAIIGDAEGRQFNYINREGKLLSTLWFARALPFYGDQTIAYVDTGNLGKPEERYSLHVISSDGEMKRWQYCADMQGVVNAACGMVLLSTGELVSLKDVTQVICQTDFVAAYLDCNALVVRDQETGKYGLFVKGEQHYDFAYDKIEPVPCDMQWMKRESQGFVLCAVTEAQYPQPLSHYFMLEKDGAEEMVALSTRSVYPVILK